MYTCIFFGHRDSPESLQPRLYEATEQLILQHQVNRFFVGHQGAFDRMAADILSRLALKYPGIQYAVVLACLPKDVAQPFLSHPTLLPDGMESIPRRFAISHRNEWLLKQADYVIGYMDHGWGGAARYLLKAQRQKKSVILIQHHTSF